VPVIKLDFAPVVSFGSSRPSRVFTMGERVKIRPAVDVFNLFNNTIFSFGSEFIDRDDADFLVPRRTQRARTIQLSMKVSF
jgi:hypothetical protein